MAIGAIGAIVLIAICVEGYLIAHCWCGFDAPTDTVPYIFASQHGICPYVKSDPPGLLIAFARTVVVVVVVVACLIIRRRV